MSEALELSENPSVQHFLQHTDSAASGWDNWTGHRDESGSSYTGESNSQGSIIDDTTQEAYPMEEESNESSSFATSSDTSSDNGEEPVTF